MEAAAGLLLVLLGVSYGLETNCDGRKDGAQCYGALGGTVYFHLMDDASQAAKYDWNKASRNLLKGRRGVVIVDNDGTRFVFTESNGTFTVNQLSRSDGGNYTLEIRDDNGKLLTSRTLDLFIQAPVSSVRLTYDCLSLGVKRASCSSEEGDSPRYSWTLDGQPLTDTELLPGDNAPNGVTLRVNVSGELLCSVSNDVSSVSKVEPLPTCGYIFIHCNTSNGTEISEWVHEETNTLCVEPTTLATTEGKETTTGSVIPSTNTSSFNQTVTSNSDNHWFFSILPIFAGVLSALIIFLFLGIAVICVQKRKRNNKPEDEEDEQELTYADVRVIQRRSRKVEPRADESVEYGEVKFTDRPRQTEAAGQDCLYSEVRKAR